MSSAQIFGLASGLANLVGTAIYLWSIIKGNNKPSRVAWLIWSCVQALILLSYVSINLNLTNPFYFFISLPRSLSQLPASWLSLATFIGCLLITVLTLSKGQSLWYTFDTICLSGALITATIWLVTASAWYGLILSLFIDFMGYLSTFYHIGIKHYQESLPAWSFWWLSGLTAVLAVNKLSFAQALFPWYILISNSVVLALILWLKNKPNLAKLSN